MKLSLNPITLITIKWLWWLLLLCFCLSGFLMATAPSDAVELVSRPSRSLQLTIGKSVVLRTDQPVKRISIADPEIADFVMVSSKEIYLTGKRAGATNMMLWKNGTVSGVYDLDVRYDLSALKQQLYELMPEEKNLSVTRMNDTITLSGALASADKLAQVTALAKTFAPEEKVTNLIQVGGGHQVMLEVRVAEISKATAKRLGFNFNYSSGSQFGFSLLGGLTQIGADNTLSIAPSVQALLQFEHEGTTWAGFIDALHQDGLVKVLAKPTLICLSGKQANFLAGGEFPVPVPDNDGDVGIEWKAFGVALDFKPVVISNERINIEVTPEVSELDFSTSIHFSGYVVPGLSARRASTTIELGDGQSFAIAGLIKENIRDSISKFPILGDIPILGALFRSREFQKSETELVIIVTPRLVKPLRKDQIVMPTDHYVEPNNYQIFLGGVLQGGQRQDASDATVGLIGPFGHTMPDEN